MSRDGRGDGYTTAAQLHAKWERHGQVMDFDIATKVMGWTPDYDLPSWDRSPGYWYWHGKDAPTEGGGVWADWRPSTDLNICKKAEQRMIELGKGRAYAGTIAAAIKELLTEQKGTDAGWELALLMAPPEARCRAMLSVLEGEG